VAKLLRDLGPKLRRGDSSTPPNARVPTGIESIDRLLGGGFPGGRLSEIAGPLSCGRTSLAHALLAQATQSGAVAAVVDAADAFDPASAEGSGVDLTRVLWVRAPRLRSALRSTEQLLAVRGFALVLLDLALADLHIVPATGLRLARLAAGTGIPLIALSLQRCLGPAAEIAIELRPTQANCGGSPVLLENLEVEVALVRHRSAPDGNTISVRLHPNRAA
jgi:hypothetical protein